LFITCPHFSALYKETRPAHSSAFRNAAAKFMLFLVVMCFSFARAESRPVIARICTSESDRSISISWRSFKDTCDKFIGVNVYAFNKLNNSRVLAGTVKQSNLFYFSLGAGAYDNYLDSFYIEYSYSCNGVKTFSRSNDVKLDITPPNSINPDSISVSGKKVIISWKAETSTDTKGYIIYTVSPGRNTPVDTVYGRLSTFYEDSLNSDPDQDADTFRLAVLDSCDNVSALGSEAHTTIFLNVSQDSCSKVINLQWSPYRGWAVDSYAVYSSIDKGLHFTRVGLVSGKLNSFSYRGVSGQSQYILFVRAIKLGAPGVTSSSNVRKISTTFSSAGTGIYLSLVTVNSKGILLQWKAPDVRNIKEFIVEGGKDSVRFVEVGNLPSTGAGNYSFDDNSNDGGHIQYYRISGIDYCGNKLGAGNWARNIVLSGSTSSKGRLLRWNSYKHWKHRATGYRIYRSTSGNDSANRQLIATVGGDTLFYLDKDSIDGFDNNGICYVVTAIGIDSSFNVPAISFSNELCLFGPPIVRMPNAFVINGFNKVFKPITLYADLPFCSMNIYNRWGELIYQTGDIVAGWDGRSFGGYVIEGVYFYIVNIMGFDKSLKVVRGTFNVLR
jgi:hypothetical protein